MKFNKEERYQLYKMIINEEEEVDKKLLERLLDAYDDETHYHESTMRALAKEMAPYWVPWEFEENRSSQGSWGLPGLGGYISKDDDGKYKLWVRSRKQAGLGTDVPLIYGLEAIRKSAISLLVFCELEEMRNETDT